MRAYYNEIDPFAAAWLRNLIAGGHISEGEVDERSIRDVAAEDLRGFDRCHFFAGIGGWELALRYARGRDDARPVWTGSCPCQPFSQAGKRQGFADDRHLWPVWRSLIENARPRTVLESKLRARLNGSDLCEVTWQPWTMFSGRVLSRPRARVRTTSETDSGLWPTIRANKWGPPDSHGDVSMWATPRANEANGAKVPPGRQGGLALKAQAQMWPTPQARDHFPAHTEEYIAEKKAEGHGMANLNDVATWGTPHASDGEKGGPNMSCSGGWTPLPAQAAKSTWPTTTTRDHKDGRYQPKVPINSLLGRMVWPTPTPTSLAPAKDGNNEAGNSAGLVSIRRHAMAATWPTATANENAGDPKKKAERRAKAKEKWKGISGNGMGFSIAEHASLIGSSEQTESAAR